VIRALVTDIEGTTTSIAFVKDVLFPHARARLPAFVRANARDPEVRRLLDALPAGAADDEARIALLVRYIDEDRKDTILKDLQGRVWRDGYTSGAFVSHLYPEVAAALRRWRGAGVELHVFSSGSVEAQRLLFGHTAAGDLTPLFSGWFDTTTGKKNDPASYRAIADAMKLPPEEVGFLSDTPAELDAAREAGFSTWWVCRDGSAGADTGHRRVTSFDDVSI
jgi:enolase-phosphatase E1